MAIEKVCERCRRSFKPRCRGAAAKAQKFCSVRCGSINSARARELPSEPKTCEACGKQFERGNRPHTVWKRLRFCSPLCRAQVIAQRHGLSYTPEYRAWQTMRLRCTEPTNAAYPNYGGRGITVCDRWLNSPEAFYADMGPKPSAKHELDRIDNNGPYSPENCRWVSRTDNCRNRRSNRRLTHNGETLTLAEWSERTGIPTDALTKRLRNGWSVETALTTPLMNRGPRARRAS